MISINELDLKFTETRKWYDEHKEELLQQYGAGTYLLILRDPPEVADSDKNFSSLLSRAHDNYKIGLYLIQELTTHHRKTHVSR
ncbi:MAG: hypothetical protein HYS62_03290 [Candidatus Aenigmarchaeota archaeon]|nr:hypothetical protein [Candidatus Aenigmarchaeota archaeon]